VLVLIEHSFKLSQVMGIAKRMGAAVSEVGFPMIVTDGALVLWQYPHLVYRFTAAFGVGIKAGKAVIRDIMQPTSDATDIDTGFVAMN
jgi:hypothetical protein